MEKVVLKCDRCKNKFEGFEDKYSTAGFYRITEGTYWARFANNNEEIICDSCMHKDPRYIAVYGPGGYQG